MGSKTNAVRLVEQAGISCKEQFYEYQEDDLSGMHAAQALGKGFKCHCVSRPPSQSVMRRISSSIWSTSRSISALGE